MQLLKQLRRVRKTKRTKEDQEKQAVDRCLECQVATGSSGSANRCENRVQSSNLQVEVADVVVGVVGVVVMVGTLSATITLTPTGDGMAVIIASWAAVPQTSARHVHMHRHLPSQCLCRNGRVFKNKQPSAYGMPGGD